MKIVFLAVLFIAIATRGYSQRNFTLVDATRRDTLVYMNDRTGNYVPISINNLIINRDLITKVQCGNNESIRSSFLKRGIATLINFSNGTVGDKRLQISAYKERLGFWAEKNTVQRNYAETALKRYNDYNKKNKVESTHPQYYSSFLKKKITSTPKLLNDAADEQIKSSKIRNQRVYVYRYTKNRIMYFRRKTTVLAVEPIGIKLDEMSVDYKYIDTIYCSEAQMILKKLLLIGAVGLNYPNDKKHEMVKKSFFFAQNHRLGIWKNFNPADLNTLRPTIEESDPPSSSDPDKTPLSFLGKCKKLLGKIYHNTFGSLLKSEIANAVSYLANIVLVVLQIVEKRKPTGKI